MIYPTQKGYFAYYLYQEMKKNKKIWLIVGDLGYGMFDKIRDDFPERYLNTGAAEQAMMGIACGLAFEGKIPFVYTIPNFLIYRPFEWVRNYIDHEKCPVKLISGGQGKDYLEDGYTHQAEDMKYVMGNFPNIRQHWVKDKEEVPSLLKKVIKRNQPEFISLSRKL